MAESVNPNAQDYSTVVGPDVQFKGTLSFEKALRLHGRIEGHINTAGRLHIAREGKMQGEVDASAIIVEGEVRGNLTASDRVELKQTANYEGDLKTVRLVVDAGAVFTGHVSVGPEAVKNGNPKTQNARPSNASPAKTPEPAMAGR